MAKRKYLVDFDLNQNELQNAVIQNLATAPENPVAGQHYFNTTDNTEYVFDGTQWVDALNQGKVYTFTDGVQVDSNDEVTLKLDQGQTALSIDANHALTIASASTTQAGVIEIATDEEVATGTSETLAVNPKQLADAVADKIELTDLSIAAGSTDYIGYDNTNGQFSANVDTTVTENSTNLVTSGAVRSAIDTAIVGGVNYRGTFNATGQTDYSSITLPVKKGYLYLVEGSATIGGIEWNAGDFLIVNADVPASGTLTNVSKIDNTEGLDIVRLDATQTLTNKTIDADNNTISNLELDNFKSGVVVDSTTGIAGVATASDDKVATEKAIATALAAKTGKFSVQNPALTAASGECVWPITNTLADADVHVSIIEVSSGEEVFATVEPGAATINVTFNSTGNISANTYKAIVIG